MLPSYSASVPQQTQLVHAEHTELVSKEGQINIAQVELQANASLQQFVLMTDKKLSKRKEMDNNLKMASKPVARGGAVGVTHTPNLPKGPLFATKLAKNGVL